MHMSRYLLLLLIACIAVSAGGCLATNTPTTTPSVAANASNVSSMGDVDALLQNGPVFVEFGATWCYWCTREQPVIDALGQNYTGITYVHIDTDENQVLPVAFGVGGIPQMDLIVSKNADGSYTYIDPYGKATTDRMSSRIIGYTDYGPLESLLKAAIAARGK